MKQTSTRFHNNTLFNIVVLSSLPVATFLLLKLPFFLSTRRFFLIFMVRLTVIKIRVEFILSKRRVLIRVSKGLIAAAAGIIGPCVMSPKGIVFVLGISHQGRHALSGCLSPFALLWDDGRHGGGGRCVDS